MKFKMSVTGLALSVVAVFTAYVSVQYNPEGDFETKRNYDGKSVAITAYKGSSPIISIPPVINRMPVTVIGEGAFKDHTGLTSITIPDSVWRIGDWAFAGCIGLTDVTIGSGVTVIGDYAFAGCSGLRSINIPGSVTKVGNYAFFECNGLTDVTIGKRVTEIGYGAFLNCTSLANIIIPDSVTAIRNGAFSICDSLTSITIPDSVMVIGNGAFSNCASLTKIIVSPNNQNYSSRDGVLYNKEQTMLIQVPGGIKGSFTVPDSVMYIYHGAFTFCKSLTDIAIPDSVMGIGERVFYHCYNLTGITVSPNNQNYSSRDGVLYDKEQTLLIQAPGAMGGSFTVPDSVTAIDEGAFISCRNLTSVNIGHNVTVIDDLAFSYCFGLTSVTVGNNVMEIGNGAFYYCTSLTNVTIGNGVTEIGNGAFSNCTSLTSITVLAVTPPALGWVNIFEETHSNLRIEVPAANVEAYKAAPEWREFADRITAIR